ncbi:unnamed protein product [marine sediment metagenome]|uniref:Uncharacterized protein n=1 Tax=marine sediment metagenome TaxID=412755 RepID=X0RPM5_9ZZZZ
MSITLDLIMKKATNKFVDDVESDLYKYKRLLTDAIQKGGEKKVEKKLLAEVNVALGDGGETVEVVKTVKEPKDDWKTRRKKKEIFYKKAAIEAISEHFDID